MPSPPHAVLIGPAHEENVTCNDLIASKVEIHVSYTNKGVEIDFKHKTFD